MPNVLWTHLPLKGLTGKDIYFSNYRPTRFFYRPNLCHLFTFLPKFADKL